MDITWKEALGLCVFVIFGSCVCPLLDYLIRETWKSYRSTGKGRRKYNG